MKKLVMQGVVMIVLLMALTGCGPRDTRSFPQVNPAKSVVVESKNIEIKAHLMSRKECEAYFDVDVISQGYRPLVLTIANKGLDSYVFRPSYLPFPRVSGKEISRLMHYDTYQRVVWMTIPAIFLCWELIPIVIVPYGFACRNYNDKTTRNIRKKTLGRSETLHIAPHEVVQKLIFVPGESFRPQFEMKLYNETTRLIETYQIDTVAPLKQKATGD